MSILLKDGTPFTPDMQTAASLIHFETPKGNVIVINDNLMNVQSILLSKEDFAKIANLHNVGGEIIELQYNEALVSGEFDDVANELSIFPEFEKIEDPCNIKHVGTIVFEGKDISKRRILATIFDGEHRLFGLMHNQSFEIEPIAPSSDREFYRLTIKLSSSGSVDVLKAISVDVGPIQELQEDDQEEEID